MSWRKIKEFFEYLPYNIKNGIKNLIVWFSVIWQDRNWDQYYIFKILRHKLYLAEKCMNKNAMHVGYEKDCKKMRICIHILDRFINNVHFDIAWKKYDKKWGKTNLHFIKCSDSDYSTLEITKENVKTEKDKKEETADFKRTSKFEQEIRKQDLEMLFRYLHKNIEKWWV